jgi:hypothetical protein
MTNALIDSDPVIEVFDPEHLTYLMKAKGVSVTELGARCGRSAFTVKLYAMGRVDPPACQVALMAFALGVRVEELFRPALPEEIEVTTLVASKRIRRTS